ncbi:MAG: DNA-deoxyinosine glycosylase [Burkholderiales bacterium]|nr:DNA-deoxyinosine glycosylase [Burkholderiales bacterium]
MRLHGLPPLVDVQTRVLVLGSFPGVASLRALQYYGHPRNHFWPIMAGVFNGFLGSAACSDLFDSYQKCCSAVPVGYAERCKWLLAHGVGLWDVYGSCQRQGSLDADIRQPQVNDFAHILALCPHLQLIAHNGGESFKHARHTHVLGVPVVKLPSSSPANASWSFERKKAAWTAALGGVLARR